MSSSAIIGKYGKALTGLVGIMLIMSIAGLGMMAAGGAYSDDYTILLTSDRSGFGLDSKSTVKVRGVTVGSVEDVALSDEHVVQIRLNIRKDVRIPASATARIEPLSVFGPKFINLIPGDGESTGPFLGDGDTITETLEPSEVIETLERISRLFDVIDAEDVSIILTEFGRGFDGLGATFGEVLDNSSVIVDRAQQNSERIDALLADARTITAAFENRGDDFAESLDNLNSFLQAAGLTDVIDGDTDPLAELLVGTAELSNDLAAVLRAGGDDLAVVLETLDPVSELLYSNLGEVPELLTLVDDILRFIGDDLISWDVGAETGTNDGRLGAVVGADVRLDTCILLGLGC